VLSRESEFGNKVEATEAALDKPVAESVFAPHLSGGFDIPEGAKP
jgi:hypothetical protein